MKFRAMKEHKADYPIEFMCRVFGVSKSGYYEWLGRAEDRDEKSQQEQRVVQTIEAIHLGSKKKYGSPNVTPILQGLGFDMSESTVARRMKKYGIRSKLKRKFKATTDSDHKLPVAPNLLMQDFTAYRPNQIWMSDITYVSTREGWLYVCGIIDLYSRKIVAWTASSRMTQDLVIATFLKACRDRSPDQHLIFHSDRGSQYASRAFRRLLRRLSVLQSMSRRACCWDSAPIESFWGRLKTECVFWGDFATREDALHVIRDWIELDYNATRPHSSLDHVSPNEFEAQFMLASFAVNE
jgi:transposase InsO family protein